MKQPDRVRTMWIKWLKKMYHGHTVTQKQFTVHFSLQVSDRTLKMLSWLCFLAHLFGTIWLKSWVEPEFKIRIISQGRKSSDLQVVASQHKGSDFTKPRWKYFCTPPPLNMRTPRTIAIYRTQHSSSVARVSNDTDYSAEVIIQI